MILKALARFDAFPRIEGPDPGVRPARLAGSPATPTSRAPARSVVKVLGTACGLGVQGSGWLAADGLVVTNAHVVAGQDDTTVELRGEDPGEDAEAVWFDTRNDLALLRVPGPGGRAGARRSAAMPREARRPRSSASPRTVPTTCARRGSARPRRC